MLSLHKRPFGGEDRGEGASLNDRTDFRLISEVQKTESCGRDSNLDLVVEDEVRTDGQAVEVESEPEVEYLLTKFRVIG